MEDSMEDKALKIYDSNDGENVQPLNKQEEKKYEKSKKTRHRKKLMYCLPG